MEYVLQTIIINEKMVLYILIGVIGILIALIFMVDYQTRKKDLENLSNMPKTPLKEDILNKEENLPLELIEEENKVAQWVSANTGSIPMIKEDMIPVSEIKYVQENEQLMAQEELKKVTKKLETEALEKNKIVDDLVETIEEKKWQEKTKEIFIEPVEETILTVNQNESLKENTSSNITLTSFEEDQEASAIISLNELFEKAHTLYNSDTMERYEDEEEDAPINLKELSERFKKEPSISEEKVVTVVDNNAKKFTSSPILSPIYGITNDQKNDSIVLENTANYDKLDEEIRKTNYFLETLQELRNNLKD